MTLPTTGQSSLHTTWLPLQLPLEDDVHVLAEFFNAGPQRVNMATGVRRAHCSGRWDPVPKRGGRSLEWTLPSGSGPRRAASVPAC